MPTPRAFQRGPYKQGDPQNQTASAHSLEASRHNNLELIQQLRWPPKDHCVPCTSGLFLWPSKRVTLSDFGADISMLDQIRKQYQCHVVFDQELKCLGLYSHQDECKPEDIANAIEALHVALCECIAKSTKALKAYFTILPATMPKFPVIALLPSTAAASSLKAAGGGISGRPEMIAELRSLSSHHGAVEIAGATKLSNETNLRTMSLATSKSLEKLQYRRGRIQLRGLLGIFMFTRYLTTQPPRTATRNGVEPVVTFIENLADSKTQGALHRLAPESHLLERVHLCADLFGGPGGDPSSVCQVRPFHIGVFTFAPEARGDTAGMQLRIITSSNAGPGELAPKVKRNEWSTSGASHAMRCLELFVPNLQPGELSWKLEIAVQQTGRPISRELRVISQALKLLPPSSCDIYNGEAELMFDVASMHARPRDFYQKTCWQYRLKADPGYIFEVSRLDRYDQSSTGRQRPTGPKLSTDTRRPVETEWDACIFHTEWDERLGQNLTLRTGQRADWDTSLEAFFPSDRNDCAPSGQATGFGRFSRIIQEVARRLSHAKGGQS